MYLRLIKVPPHVKILTSMGPTGPRFLAFLPSKSSVRNSSSSLLALWVLHKIYYILPTLLYYKYTISVVLVVLMVVEVICLHTSTCTCPAKEQVQVLQVQVLQVQVLQVQVLQVQVLQVQLPAQQGGERELSRKCVFSSDNSLLPSSLPAPEGDDEIYVGDVGDDVYILWWSFCVCDCLSRKMSTFLKCPPLPRQPPISPPHPPRSVRTLHDSLA